jgi:aspartate aminotransferase
VKIFGYFSMRRLRLSQRAINTPSSPIRKLAGLADKAESEGCRVLKLNIGQPDVPSPDSFFEGVKDYHSRIVAYDPSLGNLELRKAWSDYINRTIDIEVSYESLLITQGASEALIFIFMTCCDPGDEIIIFDPTYANYIGFGAISGVNLVPVPCELSDGFHLPSRENIESRFSNRTRAILLCNPNNPTGTVYSKKELLLLLELCEDNNIFLVLDETYREMVYGETEVTSILHLAPANPRVIVVDSLSKRFSLCGARIGCIITCNDDVKRACFNIAQARLSVASIEQHAAAFMLRSSHREQLEVTRKLYHIRRDALIGGLRRIEGVETVVPEGAFYAIAKLPVDDADSFCAYLLTTFRSRGRTVFLSPASGFFIEEDRGKDQVRLAYVLKEDELRQAVEVLEEGIKAYNLSST